MEVTITSENFESLKNGNEPLVVDFWATWCGPCRMVGPVISKLAEKYDGKIVVGKCDVEENEDSAVEALMDMDLNGLDSEEGEDWTANCRILDEQIDAGTEALREGENPYKLTIFEFLNYCLSTIIHRHHW